MVDFNETQSDNTCGLRAIAFVEFYMSSVKVLESGMKEGWKNHDLEAVKSAVAEILTISPEHVQAKMLRLRTALAEQDWAVVANAASAVVSLAPDLAFLAARRLAREGDLVGSAKLFIELRKNAAGPTEEVDKAAQQIALALLKAGTRATFDRDNATAQRLWRLGAQVAPEIPALQERVHALAVTAAKTAKEIDLAANPAGYVRAWEEVLLLDPSNLTAAKKLTAAADKSGDARQIMNSWLRILELDKQNDAAMLRIAKAAVDANLDHEALAQLRNLGLANPETPSVASLRKRLQAACRQAVAANDVIAAADHLALLIDTAGGDEHEFETLRAAVVLRLTKAIRAANKTFDRDGAAAVAQRLLRFDPRNVYALLVLAQYSARVRRPADTIAFCERLIAIDADHAKAHDLLDRAKSKLSQSERPAPAETA